MINEVMLTSCGSGRAIGLIRVAGRIRMDWRPGFPPDNVVWEDATWQKANGWSKDVPEAPPLHVEGCPGAHLTLKSAFKSSQMRELSFRFLAESDAGGGDEAVSKLLEVLKSKRFQPVIFTKDMEFKRPDCRMFFQNAGNNVDFDFSLGSRWETGLYLGVEESPPGSKQYYLQFECYIGLTR